MVRRRSRSLAYAAPVGPEITLPPDIPDQREAWETEAWETPVVDTSYSTHEEPKMMSMKMERIRKEFIDNLYNVHAGSSCDTCCNVVREAEKTIEYLTSLLSDYDAQKQKIRQLESEVDRYLTQMMEYKSIADAVMLRRSTNPTPDTDTTPNTDTAREILQRLADRRNERGE